MKPEGVVEEMQHGGEDGREAEDALLELWNGGSIGPDFNDDDPIFMTDKFRMYCYKVLPCPKRFCHDWSTCPFAHFSERAKRRDPRCAKYTAIACPEMKKQGEPCPRGDKCPYSHNTFEYWLHPTRYRTRICRDGEGCTRKVCFFAHRAEDVRVPPCRPSLPVADDPWPASDDSADSCLDAPFGSDPAGKSAAAHRRASSAPSEASKGLSGRLSDMLKKIPSRQQSNGFHQPSSQDLGSTFFEKVLESIKDGNVPSMTTAAPQNAEAVPDSIPPQPMTQAQLGQAVTNILTNLCLQNQGTTQPVQQPVQQQTSVLEALANQVSMPPANTVSPGSPPLASGMPAAMPAVMPSMPSAHPMGYFPVVPGGLPPGMALMPEGMPGGVPVGSLQGIQGVPFGGVNNTMMPDFITSANGTANLAAANGNNINDLIHTILNLQSPVQSPAMVSPQYVNGNGYLTGAQGNGVQPHVMMNASVPAYGDAGLNGSTFGHDAQKGVVLGKDAMASTSVAMATVPNGETPVSGNHENNGIAVPENGMGANTGVGMKPVGAAPGAALESMLSQSLPHSPAFVVGK